jgi:repressor LexA
MAPTVREIAAHLGLRSPAGVHRLLNVLKNKGYIMSDPGKKRSWRFSHAVAGDSIPLMGNIAAGEPIESIEDVADALPVSPTFFGKGTFFGLRVRGDSMIEAHIMDGDIAIIRPQKQVENGEIAAVTVEGILPEATLKTVRRDRSSVSLMPANSAHAPLVFKGPQRKRVSIIGKLVGLVRRS